MKTLLDVKRGMARDQVLAGLADRFVLEKEEIGGGLESWTARPKKPGEEDAGTVFFDNGKVIAVRLPMTPVLSAMLFASRGSCFLYFRFMLNHRARTLRWSRS